MCEMAMDDDDMDSSDSGSGSGSMDITESVCTSDGLRDNMTACDANAICMWETFDTGDDEEEDEFDSETCAFFRDASQCDVHAANCAQTCCASDPAYCSGTGTGGGMCSAISCWNQVRVFCWPCCSFL